MQNTKLYKVLFIREDIPEYVRWQIRSQITQRGGTVETRLFSRVMDIRCDDYTYSQLGLNPAIEIIVEWI